MRKNFGAKPVIYPQPVLIIGTYDANGVPDAMNAAWGGISEETEISICLSPEHKTVENILARKAFTVSMADADPNDPHYRSKNYRTCRNWQFAYKISKLL